MVRLTILGSGSSGNCAVVSTGQTTVLVDAGLSAKQIGLRMEAAGFRPDALDGILITHEHQDHTRGLEIFCSKRDIPLFCTSLTQETLLRDVTFRRKPSWQLMQTGHRFSFRDLEIECFPVPHDAVDPVGFAVADAESRLGVLSDVGHVTTLIRDRLAGSDSLFIEANYCAKLLEADVKRPWATKQRISSRHGHLSNDQAAELVEELAHPRLRHVVLGHLSDDCNDPVEAVRCVREGLRRGGAEQAEVCCAGRREITPTMEVALPRVRVAAPEPADPPQQLALFD